ncbi:hypothetical protein BH20ACT3_BH20ACT3_02640 [soil metagenome]
MRTLLVILTVVEIVIFLGAVAGYLVAIEHSLARTSTLLGKVAFGVRAIEKQAEPIGPGVTRINEQLAAIAGALDGVATLAEGPSIPARPRTDP